jgi:hypothetical protein
MFVFASLWLSQYRPRYTMYTFPFSMRTWRDHLYMLDLDADDAAPTQSIPPLHLVNFSPLSPSAHWQPHILASAALTHSRKASMSLPASAVGPVTFGYFKEKKSSIKFLLPVAPPCQPIPSLNPSLMLPAVIAGDEVARHSIRSGPPAISDECAVSKHVPGI